MEDRELKVRLLEAAAQLPPARVGTDAGACARAALEIAESWYNMFVAGETPKQDAGPEKQKPEGGRKEGTLRLKGKKRRG